ncbi:hypothetical protein FIU97_17725 [Roseivivax sp. THAF40]|uniref:hypothetical protein n=1 Tax=unclassified Roseivivax TaxID=2639302 RepID=UPI0012A8C846|nr:MULTISPECIES: hypothetical protein [unclassified Roseivivax]QFS84602.1 hypothetical protein FIV09_17315 [Roseivivax sp. THAF197b]QFT48429.1 hypothetical protein FIU97_17725 [Roseivivax sp. THAF40]
MIIRVGSGLASLLVGWLGVLAVTMALSDAAPAALVLFPSDTFLSSLPDHVAISDRFTHAITLVSSQPGYVASLYEAGARLVLPAGLAGCLSL